MLVQNPKNWIVWKVAKKIFSIHAAQQTKHALIFLLKSKHLQSRQLHLDENLHQRLFARVCILCSFQKGYLVHLVEKRGRCCDSRWPIFFCHSNITPGIHHKIQPQFLLWQSFSTFVSLFFSQNIWYLNVKYIDKLLRKGVFEGSSAVCQH